LRSASSCVARANCARKSAPANHHRAHRTNRRNGLNACYTAAL
jgi:hypothetical protein